MLQTQEQTAYFKPSSRNTFKKVKSEAAFRSQPDGRDGKKIDVALYEDAKRRWNNQETQKRIVQKLEEEQIQSTKPPTGNKNSKYAAQKFEKEFVYIVCAVLDETTEGINCDIQTKEELEAKKLNYVKVG